MQQDTDTLNPSTHVFIDGRWLPRIAGGTNEFDGDTADTATVEPAAGATEETGSQPVADSEESSREPGAFDEGFDPESLPPEIRARYDEMSRDYYAKTQSVADQRREGEAAMQLFTALQDPQTSIDAFVELGQAFGAEAFMRLASAMGFELPEDDEDADYEDDEDGSGRQQQQPAELRDPRLDQMLYEAELEALEQQMVGQVNELAKSRHLKMSDDEIQLVLVQALSMPPHVNGEPNVDGAFTQYAQIREGLIANYRQSKQPPQPPVAGSPGVPDDTKGLGDDKTRMRRALEVANRSFAAEV